MKLPQGYIDDIVPPKDRLEQPSKRTQNIWSIILLLIAIFIFGFLIAFYAKAQETETRFDKMDNNEKLIAKQLEFTEIDNVPRFYDNFNYFEILSITPIYKGIEVQVRAWDFQNRQYGFGKNGDIDIERIRIINPPLLVPTPMGEVTRITYDIDNFEQYNYYTLNPLEALKKVVSHTIYNNKIKKINTDIIPNTVSKTTTVIYSESGDGHCYNNHATTWSLSRGGATASQGCDDALAESSNPLVGDNGGLDHSVSRLFFAFDTSSIGSDTISSSTMHFYAGGAGSDTTGDSNVLVLADASQASESSLISADFDNITLDSPDEWSDSRSETVSTITDEEEIKFVLNSHGIGDIVTDGYTKASLRLSSDVDDVDPGLSVLAYARIKFVDETGTTFDPVLIIDHTGAVTPTSTTSTLGFDTATSSIEQAQQNIFNALVLFFLSAFLLGFYLKVNDYPTTK